MRILLVDDNDAFRTGLRAALGAQPELEVVGEAKDGSSALRLVKELAPEIVLIDVIMPGLGGIEATRRILALAPDVKVIAVSMHRERAFVEGMLAAGASGYLLKEAVLDELSLALRSVSSGGIYLSRDLD